MKHLRKLISLALVLAMVSSIFAVVIPTSVSAASTNVALNKPYTTSKFHPEDGPDYPDENGVTMTDGKIATSTTGYSNAIWAGFNSSTPAHSFNGYSYVSVDLGDNYKLDKFVAYFGTQKLGSGITAPEFAWVYISDDNKEWYRVGKTSHVDSTTSNVVASTLTLDSPVTARYVQFRVIIEYGWAFICEVEAFGEKSTTKIPHPDKSNQLTFLFVGNSSTYYFNNPTEFVFLAESAGVDIEVYYCCRGSAYLSYFADPNQRHGQELRAKLKERKYDYVVLQDNSGANFPDSKAAIDVIKPLIDANGAEMLLYARYSSNTSTSGRPASGYKHYLNYKRLAKEYNVTKNAPVVDAFLICQDKYPSINLHWTDNSHHSKVGTYLITCVWAIEYLGIDLSKVTYTGRVSATVAEQLKECARLACSEGYTKYPVATKTIDGTKYYDITTGKAYTSNGTKYDDPKGDTGIDGRPLGKLTDNTFASEAESTDIGCYNGKTVDIVIDLEGTYAVKYFTTDMFGNDSWGIKQPSENEIILSASADGKNFVEIAKVNGTYQSTSGEWTKYTFTYQNSANTVSGRYLKVTYNNKSANTPKTFFWTSEISAFGEKMPEPAHTCTGTGNWQKDYTGHWKVCSCGEATDFSAHDNGAWVATKAAGYDNDGERELRCTVCGYVLKTETVPSPHGALNKWESNANNHWHLCKCGCGHKYDNAAHVAGEWEELGLPENEENNILSHKVLLCKDCGYKLDEEIKYKDNGDPDPDPDPDPDVETKVMLGDVNGSKDIDSMDYVLVKRAYFGTFDLTDDQLKAADVNDSGDIDSMDYVLIKRAYFGTFSFE